MFFFIGVFGFVTRRNLIAMLISVELVLNAVDINFTVFNRLLFPDQLEGFFFTLFSIGVAAAETAVAVAIIINVFRFIPYSKAWNNVIFSYLIYNVPLDFVFIHHLCEKRVMVIYFHPLHLFRKGLRIVEITLFTIEVFVEFLQILFVRNVMEMPMCSEVLVNAVSKTCGLDHLEVED